MTLNINNTQFKWFTAFTAGKTEDTIARIDVGGNQRNIVAKTGDTANSAIAHLFSRDKNSKAANNEVRNLFLQTVLDMFGVKTTEELPESVRKAMRLKDFDGTGRPLTVRRITAVKSAIDANIVKEMRSSIYKKLYRPGGSITANDCGISAQKLVDAAKDDVDLLNLITARNCDVAKVILSSGSYLNSDDKMREQLELHRNNLNELREATKGDRTLFEQGLRHLSQFCDPLPDGQITKLMAEVKKLDFGPLTACFAINSKEGDIKAMFQVQKMVNSVIAKTGVQIEGDVAEYVVQAELRPYYQFLYGVICEKLDQPSRDSLYDCLKTKEFCITAKAAELIAKGKWDKSGDAEPSKSQVRDFAVRFSTCANHVCKDVLYDLLDWKYKFESDPIDKLSDDQMRQAYEQIKNLI